LNRNFFYESFENQIKIGKNEKKSTTPYEERGTNRTYFNLNSYLNPKYEEISYFDSISFYFKTILNVIQESFSNFQKNLFEGQNLFPNGLFFGGTKLEQEPKIIFEFLTKFLTKTIPGKNLKKFIHVDSHIGVGSYGEDSLFVENDENGKYSRIFGSKIKNENNLNNFDFMIKGSINFAISDICKRLNIQYFGICHEFGTYSMQIVLRSLRIENSVFQKEGEILRSDSNEKINLLRTFYPDDDVWKKKCLNSGMSLMYKCISLAEE